MNYSQLSTRAKQLLVVVSCLLLLCTVFIRSYSPAYATTGDWSLVGGAGFTTNGTFTNHIAIDSTGTPYVAFQDGAFSNKISVMKYNGTSWVLVGEAGFSMGTADDFQIALDSNDTPYVAYSDSGNSHKATVKKFDGEGWVAVGTEGFTSGTGDHTSLAIDGTTPYVAFNDGSQAHKATVMKFDGDAWVAVGTEGFGPIDGSDLISLAIHNHIPYLAFSDSGHADKASVMSFVSSSWSFVGSAGFSSGAAYDIALGLDDNGVPYVVYKNDTTSGTTVMKFSGSAWSLVGSAGFSTGQAYSPSILFHNNVPYVSYSDDTDFKPSVKKFTGSSWTQVGSYGFATGSAYGMGMALHGDTLYVAYGDADLSNKMTVMKYGADPAEQPGDSGGDAPTPTPTPTPTPGNQATIHNAEDAKSITISTPNGSTLTCSEVSKESVAATQDGNYSYPVGLINYCFTSSQTDNQVTLVFVTDLKPEQVVLRKYNPTTKTYATVSNAVITSTTYNGQAALQVVYTVTDNGPLDLNPAVGSITDPVGLALAETGVPNTGLPYTSAWPAIASLVGGIGLLMGVIVYYRRHYGAKA